MFLWEIPRVLGIFLQIKVKTFYNVYGLALKNGQKLSLAEKPGEYVPLLVDIDLKKEVNGYPNYGSNDFYNDEDIINVVKIFQNAVSENVNRHVKKLTNKNLRCVVLEKDIFIERINESEDKYIVKKVYIFIFLTSFCLRRY